MCSSNFAFEELVLRCLRASPLMNPFLTPGRGQESKFSAGLKCVRTSRIECCLNRSTLYTHVSKIVISVSEISAVNVIVGWKLFAILKTWCTKVKKKKTVVINQPCAVPDKREIKKWC